MRYMVFAVRDTVAGVFGQPFTSASKGAAIRAFGDTVNRVSDEVIHKHPDHFDLYFLGEFDDQKGLYHTIDPDLIATGKNLQVQGSGLN